MKALRTPAGRLWAWPIALAVASSIGLTTALVGNGLWDALSWLCLGLPLAMSGWCWLLRPQRPR